MISGAHTVLFAHDAEAARRFFADVLELDSVDAGGGWLIFGLPPAELAVHPGEAPPRQELYLMCEDITSLRERLEGRGVATAPVEDQAWGLLSSVEVPGLGSLGIYEPRHPRP